MKINRFGEPVEDEGNLCGCTLGWLTPDLEGKPRPCPKHKPHLIRKTDRDGLERWTVDDNRARGSQ